MTQFYSRNDVNYSGDVYSIPFKYIHKKEVKVYIDDELWTKWHFLNTNQLTLDEVPEGIGYNNIVSVRRETDIKEKVVTYDNNSLLNKENLNKSQDQLIYAVQEIYDNNVQFQSDIREEVDEKVERVSDAVEKLEFLEDSVEIANEAALEATEQAQIATEKAEETLNTYNEAMAEIDTLRQDSIDEVNQLVADHTDDLNALDQLIKKDADAIINRVGISMFDTVLKDHMLTYEETKGLALQGTYVYKNAIAGSRYGYPTFYEKCVEEFQDASNTKQWLKSNVTKVGSVVDNQGVLRGFSTANYVTLPDILNTSQAWECSLKCKITAPATTQYWFNSGGQFKYAFLVGAVSNKFSIHASSNGSSWNIASNKLGTHTPVADTYYYLKFGFSGSEYYLDYSLTGKDTDYTRDISIPSTAIIYQTTQSPNIGCGWDSAPFLSSVDLHTSSLKLNNSYIWKGVEYCTKHINGHLFYDISEKDKVDEVFASTGMAWMYGIDTENERIFLPRNNYFEQMTGNVSEVGQSVEAGLPNITGYTDAMLTGSGSGISTGALHRTITGIGGNDGGKYARNMSNITFDASHSSSVYKDDVDTVQPNAVKKLLYICVGNTVADTSWVDVVTQVANGAKDIEDKRVQALTDLTNKENAGLSALSNASNALRQTQITNCLLEVPQNIKLELNNGVLTLKAGSKVIVPNGFEDDGVTPRFDYVDIESDISYSGETNTGKKFIFVNRNGMFVQTMLLGYTTSGSTAPTSFSGNYAQWYDTENNIIKRTIDKGSTWTTGGSFPICIATMGGDSGNVASLDQVFNGFGYIGSTVWVDKGVKGLIPNGRNGDGTLNNREFTTSKVITRTFANTETSKASLFVSASSIGRLNNKWHYNEEQNLNIQSNGAKYLNAFYCNCTITNGVISNFQPKLPFRAVDQNEFNKSEISGWGMPSSKSIDLTLGASGTSYTAPANGWVLIDKQTSSGKNIVLWNLTKTYGFSVSSSGTFGQSILLPVSKGDVFKVDYTATGATNFFRFIYAQGEV